MTNAALLLMVCPPLYISDEKNIIERIGGVQAWII